MADAARPEGRPVARRLAALSPRLRLLLAALAGATAGLGHVPYTLVPLGVAGLAGLLLLISAAPGARAGFAAGWAAGTGYFIVTLLWIVEPFLVDLPRHGWMAPFALLFLTGGLALFWGAAGALTRWLGQIPRLLAVGFVMAFGLAELARSYVLTGFPWALIGYVWTEMPQRGWASVTGPHGLTLMTLILAAALAMIALGRHPLRWAVGGGLACTGFLAMGPALLPPPDPDPAARPVIRLVQPNAAQDQKWDPAHFPTFLDRQLRFTAAPADRRPDLIVWPETAIPYLLERADTFLAEVAEAGDGTPVVIGAIRRAGPLAHNSLAVIGPEGRIGAIYDKHHLVPFGEYIPFGGLAQLVGLRSFAAQDGYGYAPGPGPQLLDLGPLGRALPLICYEAIFPQDVAAAPSRPDFLMQITNDAWFGEFSGPYQHLAQARMRAVEQGLPMVRVANTGVSAMIDSAGRITGALDLGEAGFLDLPLPPPGSPTIYARTGDWPVAVLLLLTLLGLCLKRSRLRP